MTDKPVVKGPIDGPPEALRPFLDALAEMVAEAVLTSLEQQYATAKRTVRGRRRTPRKKEQRS